MTGSVGVIRDLPGYQLPPEAWSTADNIRFTDGYAEKSKGHSTYIVPSVSPYFLLPLQQTQVFYWIYAGLNAIYTTDGAINVDVTRASGAYNARKDRMWNGTIFNGIPILNNGIDLPQAMVPVGNSNPFVDLPNWPENTFCKVMKSYGGYLIALDVTTGMRRFPYMFKWSHLASPGSVPSSWDIADPTLDAGENNLADDGGYIVDGGQLNDKFIIYRENATHEAQIIGGRFIFGFKKDLASTGIFSQRCFVEFSKRHCVVTDDDMIVHDGNSKQSVIDSRVRKYLFGTLKAATNPTRAFMVHNNKDKEILFCYPTGTEEYCVEALVWNYGRNTISFKELPGVMDIKYGVTDATGEDLIINAAEIINTNTDFLDSRLYDPSQRGMMAASVDDTQLYKMDDTNQFSGTSFTSTLQRTGMDFGDPKINKIIDSVYPVVEAASGTVIEVRIGHEHVAEEGVVWGAYKDFVVGTDDKVSFLDENNSGKFIAIEYRTTGDVAWKLHRGLAPEDFELQGAGDN